MWVDGIQENDERTIPIKTEFVIFSREFVRFRQDRIIERESIERSLEGHEWLRHPSAFLSGAGFRG